MLFGGGDNLTGSSWQQRKTYLAAGDRA